MLADRLHIAFSDSAADTIGKALARLGQSELVLALPEDLACGPLEPSDPRSRAAWPAAVAFNDEEIEEVLEHRIEEFWQAALAKDARPIVWTSRRVAREDAGFLEFAWRFGDRPYDVIDLTDLMIEVRPPGGGPPKLCPAISPSMLCADHIIENHILDRARPPRQEEREAWRGVWQRLRAENAPLRVLTPDLDMVSAPITYFDGALVSRIDLEWHKTARIVGDVLAADLDASIFQCSDAFLAARLMVLVQAGVIESRGDLRRLGYSEVRLRPANETSDPG